MSNAPIFGYARTSSARERNGSIREQETAIRNYADSKGLGYVLMHRDNGISGRIPLDDRPSGHKMLLDLVNGSHVVITKIDRAFRNIADLCNQLESWNDRNITLHVLDMGGGSVATDSIMGQAMLKFAGIFAELQATMAKERMIESREFRKAHGMPVNEKIPYGKRRVGKKGQKYFVDDVEELTQIDEMVGLYKQGWNYQEIHKFATSHNWKRAIGRENREWSYHAVRRAIRWRMGIET